MLMGAPGCGKGTQSPEMKERYGICHLSTGDMLRDAIERRTPNGLRVKEQMASGDLVPDEVVFGIVKDAIRQPECRYGYILDGFPRTIHQAQMLEEVEGNVDHALVFEAPDQVILDRTSGRWIHKASGRSYHEVFRPPLVAGKDNQTGEPLVQRPEDRREVAQHRLELYKREVQPLVDFYASRGLLHRIQANFPVETVTAAIRSILDPIAYATGLK